MKFKNFEYEVKYGLIKILSYTGNEEKVDIPEKIDKYNVYTICSNAFLGLDTLKEVIIPKSIGKIEDGAFTDCENLEKIEIGIVEDCEEFFMQCPKVSVITASPRMACKIERVYDELNIFCEKDFKYTVTDEEAKECKLIKARPRSSYLYIPDEVEGYKITEINVHLSLLEQERNVKTVRLPKYLKEIPKDFANFVGTLTIKEIPKGVEKIGEKAFYYCHNNSKIVIPNTVKHIGPFAFYNFKGEIEFEEGTRLESVGEAAFSQTTVFAKNLENLLWEAPYVFKGSKVHDLTISKEMNRIPKATFKNAIVSDLYGIENITELGVEAFFETYFRTDICLNLSNIDVIEENSLRGSTFSEIHIPKDMQLQKNLFANCKTSKITFDKDYIYNEIPEECFCNTTRLEEIKLPESIKIIAKRAFYNSGIIDINLKNIVRIGRSAFYKTNVEKVPLTKTLKELGDSAFFGTNLKEVVFDDDCEIDTISNSCFRQCDYLKKVVLSKKIHCIEANAFEGSAVEEINLENVKTISFYSFSATRLEEVDLSNVSIIPHNAFSNSNLKKVILSKDLKQIGRGAFLNSNLKEINLPEGLEKIESQAFGYTKIEEIVIPDSVRLLESNAFNSSLKRITLGKGIKNLGSYCLTNLEIEELNLNEVVSVQPGAVFCCRNLKKITIPATTKHLYKNSILSCNLLKEVRIEGTLDTLELGVFDGCPCLKTVQTNDKKSGKKLLSRTKNYITDIIPIED